MRGGVRLALDAVWPRLAARLVEFRRPPWNQEVQGCRWSGRPGRRNGAERRERCPRCVRRQWWGRGQRRGRRERRSGFTRPSRPRRPDESGWSDWSTGRGGLDRRAGRYRCDGCDWRAGCGRPDRCVGADEFDDHEPRGHGLRQQERRNRDECHCDLPRRRGPARRRRPGDRDGWPVRTHSVGRLSCELGERLDRHRRDQHQRQQRQRPDDRHALRRLHVLSSGLGCARSRPPPERPCHGGAGAATDAAADAMCRLSACSLLSRSLRGRSRLHSP